MKYRTNLTQKTLKEHLHYCPETGVFTRLKSTSPSVKVGEIAGSTVNQGYSIISVGNSAKLAHRLAFLYMTGEFPKEFVDHINGATGDNRWENLRNATRSQNAMNAGVSDRNNSGFSGVGWHKKSSKWRSRITLGGIESYLGIFENLSDAVKARIDAEEIYFKEFAHAPAKQLVSITY